ncbi:phosphopantetheine-binding protein [Streptomyces hygroscopicus]|uniref:phosphopantetheine-binding protein n=1 Tax=Streptomyces hygroscopicus TaxID=1912 RepID=UPI00367B95EF
MSTRHLAGDGSSNLEEIVLGVVAEVVRTDSVTPGDSFYDLGGTSLQAVRICTRLGPRLGTDISPDTLFESGDLAEFIQAIAAARA